MIQHRTMLVVADNTGAKKLQCIRVLGGYQKRYAGLGDMVTCVVKEAVPHGTVKKSDIVQVVLVRAHKETRRPDGTYIRFDDNAAIILEGKKNKEPKGGRVLGPIPRELKERGYIKIASLASEVI